jgi:hypothetical protein
VLQHDRVGMVVVQPHVTLTKQEPFGTVPASKAELMANLTATLAVAREAPHQAEKTLAGLEIAGNSLFRHRGVRPRQI